MNPAIVAAIVGLLFFHNDKQQKQRVGKQDAFAFQVARRHYLDLPQENIQVVKR